VFVFFDNEFVFVNYEYRVKTVKHVVICDPHLHGFHVSFMLICWFSW